MKYPQCKWCVKHIATVNILANGFISFVKILAGIYGNSQAVIADAIHSVSDIFISIILFISLKISGRKANKNYPYGLGHIEFIAAAFIGLALVFTGIMIMYTAVISIINGKYGEPGNIAIMVLIVSIVSNELLHKHTICAGKCAGSTAMTATV